mmetsp:Transcript_71859/g.99548  ORF Transcript_71859/g.99548 Transcript_71859/m.99548 type:complete len:125 (+) Transcript_71859:907-1281(+)
MCITIVKNSKFDAFIMACIILNTIVLGMSWHRQSEDFIQAVEYINYVFMAIFTIEAIVKIIAMKKNYFRDSWNLFDFVIVVGSIVVLIISLSTTEAENIGVQSTILRSLRIGRVFRIVKRAVKL